MRLAILFMGQYYMDEKILDILKVLDGLSCSEAKMVLELAVTSLDKNSFVTIKEKPVIANVLS